jgi:hypothetical protein
VTRDEEDVSFDRNNVATMVRGPGHHAWGRGHEGLRRRNGNDVGVRRRCQTPLDHQRVQQATATSTWLNQTLTCTSRMAKRNRNHVWVFEAHNVLWHIFAISLKFSVSGVVICIVSIFFSGFVVIVIFFASGDFLCYCWASHC